LEEHTLNMTGREPQTVRSVLRSSSWKSYS